MARASFEILFWGVRLKGSFAERENRFLLFHYPKGRLISPFKMFNPNPDKPERIATKAQRHKVRPMRIKIDLCVLVSWWRKCFAAKYTKIITKALNDRT